MNFEPSESQTMIAETFARFLDEHSSMARVRAATSGFDADLWRNFAEMGGLGILAPEDSGGAGLGLFDAALVMEQVGRTLASGPIAEGIVAAKILAGCGEAGSKWLEPLLTGSAVVSLALRDARDAPLQLVSGGSVADAIIVRDGDALYLVEPTASEKKAPPNLANAALSEIKLDGANRAVLVKGADAVALFEAGIETWKLLMGSALAGLSREALRLAAAYASEREQFGQLIGTYQGISHPLAELLIETDGGKFFVWRAIRDIADGAPNAGAEISLAFWWNARTAGRVVAQALHTFGGYGLTTEYDIHLYNLRAKAWPLIIGDPASILEEGGRRQFLGESVSLPEAGEVTVEFDLGDDARALAEEVDAFFNATLTPELRAKAHYSFDGHDPGVHRKLAEAGLLFPAWPVEAGGRDASPYAYAAVGAVWEKHGWTTHAAGTTNMVGHIMRRFGSEQLKREALTRVQNGECICSLGFSEPGSGSDVFAAKTRATQEADGSWRIDGQKMFTSGANLADYVLMLARTDSNVPKHKGLTMFIVPLKSEGVEIQPVYTFQQERTNITFYSGVKVPDSYRLGEINGGAKVMAASLEMEHGGSWARTQHHMLHEAETLCREKRRNGRPIIEEPGVLARLAKVAADNVVTELISYRAMWASVEKKPNLGYGSMSKLFSSEAFRVDSEDLLDLCAPESLTDSHPSAAYINLSYRHAQGTTIYGGTSEVHRSVVAERALNLPRTRA